MSSSIVEFARDVVERSRALAGFEATESLHAGPIEAKAHVRFRAPDRVIVEYSEYKNPIAEADDLLGGEVEFGADDLTALTLTYDGRFTWHANSRTDTTLCRNGRTLYEPLPGYDAIAEVGFLNELTHDFLIRDAGESEVNGRATRTLGLKAKRSRLGQLLRVVTYPFERGLIDFDLETHFAVRIRFRPLPQSPLHAILESDGWIDVSYSDVRLHPPDETAFAVESRDDAHQFTETFVGVGDLADALPAATRLAALSRAGFQIVEPAVLVTDGSHKRGYAKVYLVRRSESEAEDALLTLRFGNYISRLMARRRTLVSERGEEVTIAGVTARYLDRRSLWAEGAPEPDLQPPSDVSWEQDGIFWILSAEGLSKEEILERAASLTTEG